MIHGNQGGLKAEKFDFMNFSAKFCDAFSFQSYLRKNVGGRVSAEGDDDFGFDDLYLLVEIRRASFNLLL